MTYRMACHQADKATASHWLPHPQFYLYFLLYLLGSIFSLLWLTIFIISTHSRS